MHPKSFHDRVLVKLYPKMSTLAFKYAISIPFGHSMVVTKNLSQVSSIGRGHLVCWGRRSVV